MNEEEKRYICILNNVSFKDTFLKAQSAKLQEMQQIWNEAPYHCHFMSPIENNCDI